MYKSNPISMRPNMWRVRRDFEQVLRAMQRTADRQRTLTAHGALMSDERLPIEVLDLTQATSVEGRVLVNGQDEQTGRNYLIFEGTDAKVHFIYYTSRMEDARSRGELGSNSFIRLRKRSATATFNVNDLGDAEKLLKNLHHLCETAREFLNYGIIPTEDGWGGWLGRYQRAVRDAAFKTMECKKNEQTAIRNRRRDRSLDRGRWLSAAICLPKLCPACAPELAQREGLFPFPSRFPGSWPADLSSRLSLLCTLWGCSFFRQFVGPVCRCHGEYDSPSMRSGGCGPKSRPSPVCRVSRRATAFKDG